MAFPVVAATATSAVSTAATSHTVSLPAGIATGDLLVVIVSLDGAATVTWPAGWTVLSNASNGANARGSVAKRTVDGTEGFTGTGDTITVTTSASDESAHASYRITGAGSTLYAAAPVAETSTTPDPPALTPTPGAADILWLALGNSRNGADFTAAPTSYTNFIAIASGSPSPNPSVGFASRALNAATEDPAGFTMDLSRAWVAHTVAVYPPSGTTFTQTLAGSTTPSATLARQTGKPLAGSTTPSSVLARSTAKTVTGATTPMGGLVKSTTKILTGSTTPSGALSNSLVRLLNLAGTITPTGALAKQVGKTLTGTTSPSGSLVKRLARVFTGQVSPTGALLKLIGTRLSGTVTPSGAVTASGATQRDLTLTAELLPNRLTAELLPNRLTAETLP